VRTFTYSVAVSIIMSAPETCTRWSKLSSAMRIRPSVRLVLGYRPFTEWYWTMFSSVKLLRML